jgi:MYXO-CTERM domain-containing protein
MKGHIGASKSVLLALALVVLGAGATIAQDTTSKKTEVFTFEVISVDGNNVVIRDSGGARELTVPDDFRFTVDGTPMSVHELKAGMKGTAAVTTTTTTRPVYVTTVKKGTVVRQAGTSVWVKTEEGTRKFTKSEVDARGIKIIMDGKPTRLVDLKQGDTLTATIVTPAPPEVLTDRQVQAVLDAPLPELVAAQPPAEEPPAAKAAPATAAATEPVATVEQPPAATATPVAMETIQEVAAPAEEPSSRTPVWIGLFVVVVVGAFLVMRRRRAQT